MTLAYGFVVEAGPRLILCAAGLLLMLLSWWCFRRQSET